MMVCVGPGIPAVGAPMLRVIPGAEVSSQMLRSDWQMLRWDSWRVMVLRWGQMLRVMW